MSLRRVLPAFAMMMLCACSIQPKRISDLKSAYLHSQGRLAECASLYAKADELTIKTSAIDAQFARLTGFPHLRSNRFLASLSGELKEKHKLKAWMEAMAKRDQQARQIELQNANALDFASIEALDKCAELMMQEDLQDPEQIEKIREAAVVADSYLKGNRIFGIYPISSLFVKRGVGKLQKKIKQTFSIAEKDLAVKGTLLRYAPEKPLEISEDEIAKLLRTSSSNVLSLPSFNVYDENRLFRHFAPVWEVDEVSDDDKIGSPYWSADEQLKINTSDGVVYQYLSYMKVKGQILPQFNYIIWFPARTATSVADILSGRLDGITWRVTVGRDGKVLMYDAMHNCGCYHMFFPAGSTVMRELPLSDREEPLLVPKRGPVREVGQRVHLRIAAGSHYIESVLAKDLSIEHRVYRFADYNQLRSIAMKNGKYKSMFGATGIVPGSSRKERWLLWPMGVEDAGAMRQWGHHATAFIGRRHFDDADLLERYFSFP